MRCLFARPLTESPRGTLIPLLGRFERDLVLFVRGRVAAGILAAQVVRIRRTCSRGAAARVPRAPHALAGRTGAADVPTVEPSDGLCVRSAAAHLREEPGAVRPASSVRGAAR